jgi:acetyl esterase
MSDPRVAPELAKALTLVEHVDVDDWNDIAVLRAAQRATRERLAEAGYIPPRAPDISLAQARVDSQGHSIPVWVYRALDARAPMATFIHIHGGAFALADMTEDQLLCEELARAGFLVLSVDYRLAPEHPYPAALDDVAAVLMSVPSFVVEEGVETHAIVVGGLSAGGSLAAALCLLNRDRGGAPIALQVLNQPCLDDRLLTPAVSGPGSEDTRRGMTWMWSSYHGDVAPSYLSAPGRNDDFTGLPPALVIVTELDALRDEGLEYAAGFRRAGVDVEVEEIPSAYHGFDVTVPLSPQAIELRSRIVQRSLAAVAKVSSGR